jgi:hypothetical protein
MATQKAGSRGGKKSKVVKKKKPPKQPIELATTDWVGNTVVLYEESWLHIQTEHGITDLSGVQNAIHSPMRVRECTVNYCSTAYAHETVIPSSKEHLRVIVHYPENENVIAGKSIGSVKTAYPVDYTSPSRVGAVIYEDANSTLPPPDKSK